MRLIDVDALNADFIQNHTANTDVYLTVRKIIDNAPAVDAVEVVHGEWNMGESGVVYFCSECGCAAHPRESERWNYCPNCGAKMDGERKVSE